MMPNSGPITKQAAERGMSPAQLVKQTYEVMGTLHKTAVALGVYDGAVRYWLRKAEQEAKQQEAKQA